MVRETWTDERLDDLATTMREGFARVDQDMRDLRGEMSAGFKELRQAIFWFGGGIIVAFIGVIATSLYSGA